MLDPKILDDFVRRLADVVPAGVRGLGGEAERNLRAALEGMLGRMNVVTREDFEVQKQVLARTREKLEALEARVAELESRHKE